MPLLYLNKRQGNGRQAWARLLQENRGDCPLRSPGRKWGSVNCEQLKRGLPSTSGLGALPTGPMASPKGWDSSRHSGRKIFIRDCGGLKILEHCSGQCDQGKKRRKVPKGVPRRILERTQGVM